MTQTIILIGPMGVGKSTVSELLAANIGIPHVSLDNICRDYYEEVGYDRRQVEQLLALDDDEAEYTKYVKPYEAHAIERMVADYPNCVLDFGAGHTVHSNKALFERVKAILAPQPNVILLLPSANLDESIAILQERMLKRVAEYAEDGEDYSWAIEENKLFILHPSNIQLAKMIVYTENRSPAETCCEIIKLVSKSN